MNALAELVQGLPAAFAAAPWPGRIDACCCREAVVGALLRVPRERLGPDELGVYGASVLNTMGAPADLRYFAPRLLQLSLSGELAYPELELICHKLARAGWRDWPEAAYLRRLFDALWAEVLASADERRDADAVLCALAAAEGCVDRRLAAWERLESPSAVARLYGLVTATGLEPRNGYWWKDGPAYRAFAAWLRGDGLRAAVAEAVGRTDDELALERLFVLHDALAGAA
ncbi:hypothetical protein [Streptomyces sp. Y1]|uniref:Uncharacterized protein n=1 Tax=Streptomyces sp. Y1 TaxID=3238634 RepID=A0AB39TSE2_9ACTN